MDPFSGIVIVGHAGGDVRIYQFCDSPESVHRMNIDETLIPYENVGTQVGCLLRQRAPRVPE